MQMLGYAVTRLGLRPADFWELSPWEVMAIDAAYHKARDADGARSSYFVGHLIAFLGQFQKRRSVQEYIDMVSAPFTGAEQRWVTPRTRAEFDELVRKMKEAKHQVQDG